MNELTMRAVLLSLILCAVKPLCAQRYDLLPDIQPSPIRVKASLLTSGLPVEDEMVTEVFTQRVGPTDVAVIPNGSGDAIVTTYGGTAVRVSASGLRANEMFLDLRNPASPTFSEAFDVGGAHGFTAFAFHPDFGNLYAPGFGKFYTIESELVDSGKADFVDSAQLGRHHDDVVYEYTLAVPLLSFCDQVCADSKREVLRVLQPGWHHNLADLLFDDQGNMFISSADGSTSKRTPPFMSDNAQRLDTVFGTILRIDPLGTNSSNGKYGIPTSNPFVGDASALEEIYAYGFRNPYRLDIDPITGDLYTTDTGETRIESAYRVVPGGNHGWNLKEGSFVYSRESKQVSPDHDFNGSGVGDLAEANQLVEPIFEYDRDFGIAIVGSALNRDPELSYLGDVLVFGDFSGRLYYGDLATGQEYEFQLTDDSDALPMQIHSINAAADGGIRILGIRQTEDDFDGIIVGLEPCYGDALLGDFDRNGNVGFADALTLLHNYSGIGKTFSHGDATCDGVVSFDDFLILARNYGRGFVVAVPEPSSPLGVLLAMLGLLSQYPKYRAITLLR